MRLLLVVVGSIALLASLLPVAYPGSALGSLGMPVNVFAAEVLHSTFKIRSESLIIVGEGRGTAHMLTLQGVLALYLPLLGLGLLAFRGR
jgi:hypothetical protein